MTVVAELKGPGKVNVLKALAGGLFLLIGVIWGLYGLAYYLFLADLSVSHRTSVWILRRDARSCDAPSHVPVEPIHKVSPREISCADRDGTDCSVQQE